MTDRPATIHDLAARAFALSAAIGNNTISGAFKHLLLEESAIDGHASQRWPDGLPGASGDVSDPVGRYMVAKYAVRASREDLRDVLQSVVDKIDSLLLLSNRAIGHRAPASFDVEAMCVHIDNDDQCAELAVKGQRCAKHYMAHYRERRADGRLGIDQQPGVEVGA